MYHVALIPAARVWEGVEEVANTIEISYADDKETLEKWQRYMEEYFDVQWMQKTTPALFSVFAQPDRTNNYSECNNSVVNSENKKKTSMLQIYW